MASRSSRRRNGPLFSRKRTISLASAGPIPGTVLSSSTVARLRSSGFSGGCFLVCARQSAAAASRSNPARTPSSLSAPAVTCPRTRRTDGPGFGLIATRFPSFEATQSALPLASYTLSGPKSAACSSTAARSPTTTIWAFAESSCRRATCRTSSAVTPRIFCRYVSR